MDCLLSISNASIGYDKGPVLLSNVNVCLQPGQLYYIQGDNGAGKTTLFHTLTQDLPLIQGQISCFVPRKNIHFIPQELHLADEIPATALDVVLANGVNKRNGTDVLQAKKALDQLGLSPVQNQRYARLSSGQKKKVLLARAMLLTPQILVLDEPTANMDQAGEALVRQCVEQWLQDAICVVVASHNDEWLPAHNKMKIQKQRLLQYE